MQLVATAAWWGSKVPRGWKSIFERRTNRGQPKLAASGTRVGHVPAFLRPIEPGSIVCKTHGPVSRYPRAEQTVAARKNFTPDDLIACTWRNRRTYRISLARVRLYVGDTSRRPVRFHGAAGFIKARRLANLTFEPRKADIESKTRIGQFRKFKKKKALTFRSFFERELIVQA